MSEGMTAGTQGSEGQEGQSSEQEVQGSSAGQQQGTSLDWRQTLGELGQHPSLGPIKDEDYVQVPRGVVKRFVDQQQYIGKERLPKPQDDWSEEQWKEFDKQLGVPDSPEGYELPQVEVPEGYEVDEDLKKHALQAAHEAGVPPSKMSRFWQRFLQQEAERDQKEAQEERQQAEQQLQQLKNKYGEDWNAKADLANRAIHAAAGPDGESALQRWQDVRMADGSPLLQHPAFFEMMATLGERLHEGNLLPGEGGRAPTKSVEQLEQELEQFRAANGKALLDETHPEHRLLTQKWKDLQDQVALARQQG